MNMPLCCILTRVRQVTQFVRVFHGDNLSLPCHSYNPHATVIVKLI